MNVENFCGRFYLKNNVLEERGRQFCDVNEESQNTSNIESQHTNNNAEFQNSSVIEYFNTTKIYLKKRKYY